MFGPVTNKTLIIIDVWSQKPIIAKENQYILVQPLLGQDPSRIGFLAFLGFP